MSVTKLIEGNGLTKSFGGLTAVKKVHFYLGEGEIVGLIGPNGAGKTTLFNLVSGVFHPDAGSLYFDGNDVTQLRPFEICRLGIARTFQIVRPFLKMSCLENTLVGLIGRNDKKGGKEGRKEEAKDLLKFVGLENREQLLASNLTLIEKKRLEMARALATRPKILLLDEVLAGLNPSEILQALELIEVIRTELKVTIFWIEHVMGAIMKASDRIIVLDQGEKIREGKPEEVASDPRVIGAYLGESDA
ncbi:MAG TPA: ABC transporter ATP-binding protein [Thermodesulfobacteriota bacterium]|nr:ABC transporter ATP-binding protein [Thermodesulfobacteriota bacterium]